MAKADDQAFTDPYKAAILVLSEKEVEFPGALVCSHLAKIQLRVQQVLHYNPDMPEAARQAISAYAHALKVCSTLWLAQNSMSLDESLFILKSLNEATEDNAGTG